MATKSNRKATSIMEAESPTPPRLILQRSIREAIERMRLEYPEDEYDLVFDETGMPVGAIRKAE